eukprot:TRINITY_DN17407_c0_g1_i1.p1 TRINITY_DN17407_c0_g1~~TRINITY_DN17407_c0_g1_i1.p1  ORF type:complete len:362 (+),score=43.89 TRINITY_DN17407_c0_g1_i1:66-1088(+)
MASESMPLCPQPRKLFSSPVFWSPCRDVDRDELSELVVCSEEGRHTPPLSTASTSAGTSPNLSDCLSPGLQLRSPAPERFPVSPGVPCANQTKQSSKVFVGGIAQDMDQHSLLREFSKYGTVKKAWLQRSRECHNQPTNGEHRGFGFVVFQGEDTVDMLLGSDESRFFRLSNGFEVEVKRAVSSSAMKQISGQTACRTTYPLRSITNPPLDARRNMRGMRCEARQVQNMPNRTMSRTPTSHGNAPWLMDDLPAQALACAPMSAVGPNAHRASPCQFADNWGACTMVCIGETMIPELPRLPMNADHTTMLSPEVLFQQAKNLHGDDLVSVLVQSMPDHYED